MKTILTNDGKLEIWFQIQVIVKVRNSNYQCFMSLLFVLKYMFSEFQKKNDLDRISERKS